MREKLILFVGFGINIKAGHHFLPQDSRVSNFKVSSWIQMAQWGSFAASHASADTETQRSWLEVVAVNSHQWLSWNREGSGADAKRRNILADFTDSIFHASHSCRKHLLQWWPCIVAQPFGQQWIQNPAYVADRRPSDAAGADSFWGCHFPTGMTQP